MTQDDIGRPTPASPRVRRAEDVPLAGLSGRTVALLGYGNQGRAHALNLRDSGVEIRVGAREGVGALTARQDGFDTMSLAEATKDARASAEQFAQDSGADVGGIRKATQGYFSIEARDGEAGGWGVGDTPFKKVRVVTTVDFALD